MTTQRSASRFTRAAAFLSIPALVFAISITSADAQPGNAHRNGHGNGHAHGNVHGHGGGYRYGAGYVYGHGHGPYVAPRCAPRLAYAPYYRYEPYPVYRTVPTVSPYPVAPVPYGTVVFDPVRGVNGYVGVAGPNFSIGVAF